MSSDKDEKLSDMATRNGTSETRISVRLTPVLALQLKKEVAGRRTSESNLVREALESYFERQICKESCHDAFVRLGLIGVAKGMPRDLSTNKKHFEGFGG